MKIYLLDTNTVSEATKVKTDVRCEAWLEAHRGQCALSSITIAELRYGIERRVEGKEKTRLQKAFDFLCQDYQGRFYDFDGEAASEWGRYAAELEAAYGSDWWKHFDQRDTQIAAIAREHGLIVATRNTKHFPFCDTENPFG